MRRFYLSFLLLFLGMTSSLWAGNFNFPQNKDYPFGNRVSNSTAASAIQNIYTSWKNSFYVEGTKNGVPMARIKFTDCSHSSCNGEHTVSEGIGYGMLIFVYMDNATNQTQDEFNKLWAYYQAFDNNSNGLMEWETTGFDGVYKQGAATDGDLDVALALLLADKQWGSSGAVNYVSAAKKLLNVIYNLEVSNNFLKPGDAWDDVKNPCYFTLAAFNLFDRIQTEYGFTGADSHDWKGVLTKSYSYLSLVQGKSSAGLYPDWSNHDGTASSNSSWKYEYGMDACRTPWRVVWDYLWYGASSAQSLSQKTATWVNSSAAVPTSTGDKYNLDGSKTGSWNNAAYMGGFGCALMIDAKYSTILNNYYSAVKDFSTTEYYQQTLQILYLLMMTGNCPNFFDGSPVAGRISGAEIPEAGTTIELTFSKELKTISASNVSSFSVKINGTAGTIASLTPNATDKTKASLTFTTAFKSSDVVTLSYSGTAITDINNLSIPTVTDYPVNNAVPASGLLISDCNDTIVVTGGPWYSYNDASVKGASVVTPLSKKNTPFVQTAPGYKGATDKCAKISYTLDKGTFAYDPFVGYGFKILKDSTPVGADWSTATGIEFYHKGDACVISPFMSNFYALDGNGNPTTTVYDNQWYADIPAHADWTLVKITFDKNATTGLKLQSWFSVAQIAAAPAIDPTKFFKIQWQVQGKTGATGDVYLDELTVAGVKPKAADKTALVAAITAATTAMTGVTTGEGDGQYPLAAYNTLSSAKSAASTVNADTKATQSAVDAQTKALTDAIAAFKLTKITVTKTALKTSLDAANAVATDAKVGEGNGQFTAANLQILKDSIAVAQTIYEAAGSSQAKVTAAASMLDAAVVKFKSTAFSVNKLDLAAAVADADAAAKAAVPGTSTNQYPQQAITDYKAAVAIADGVNKDANASQAAVDKAVSDLATATTAFNAAKITSNPLVKTALISAISAAKTDTTGVKIGEGNGQYSLTSYNTIKAAIAAAESTLSTATQQSQLDGAVTTLNTAVEAFKNSAYVVSKSALNDAISSATTTSNVTVGSANGQYAQATVDTYLAAIAAAQKVSDNASASQATVDGAISTLAEATKTFKASAIVVTKTALAAKIKEAEAITYTKGDGNGQYPAAAVTAFETAKTTASDVNTDALASQAAVDKAVEDLTTAIADFGKAKVTVDYAALTKAISDAQKVYDAASIGNGNGQYLAADAATLDAAIKTATAVNGNTTATQAAVDAAKQTLDAAVAAFTPKIITVSLTALSDAIDAADVLKGKATVGSADGEYTQTVVDNFTAAINAAIAVKGTEHVTKAAVDQAVIDLNAAAELFKTSANTSAATDFSALSAAITAANNALVGKEVGTEACQYTAAVKKAFTDVIDASQAMVTAGTAKQGEVNGQITTLNNAKSTFLQAVNPEASKTALVSAIATANAAYVGKVIGSNPGQYPAADSIALRNAINAAQAVNENKCATVAQIAAAKKSVDDAIAAFLAAKVKEASKTDLAAAIALGDTKAATPSSEIGTNPGQYSQDKFAAMTTALSAAKLVYNNAAATSTEVSNATQGLNNAITAFVNSKTATVDKTALDASIATARAFLDSTATKIGSNPGQYPSAVISALQNKFNAAKSISESASSLQAAIDAAQSALATAYDIAKASRVAPIDKSALLLEITAAQAKVPTAAEIGTAVGQYSSTVVNNLKAAIAAAQTISTKTLATEKEVATALANLQAAEASLVPNTNSGSGGGGETPVTVDKDDLKTAIAAANALKLVLVQGTLPTQYNTPNDSVTMLNNTLAFAITKNESITATQTSVNIATAALVRITTNIKATLVASPSKSALNSLIAAIDAALINNTDRHPVALTEALQTALANAKTVSALKTATESEIATAATALSSANNAWKASTIDATVLKATITAAIKLKNEISKNIGTVPTTYKQADLDALVAAIATAQAKYDDASASQTIIDEADQTLSSAMDIKTIASADKFALNNKIDEANRKLNGAIAGTKPGNYPPAVYDTLVNRLELATSIKNNPKATQAQVDKAKSNLNLAIVAFENSQIPATDATELSSISLTAATVVGNELVVSAKGGEIVSVKIIGVWGGDAPAINVNASEAVINVSDLSSQVYRAQCVLSNGKVETINFVK